MKKLLATFAIIATTTANAGSPLIQRIKTIWPEYTVETIEPTPIPNLLSVKFVGIEDAAYITQDGDFLIEGRVLDLKTKQPRNLQDVMLASNRAKALANLPKSGLIIRYPAAQTIKHRLFVMVDTDCGFCQRFDTDLPALQSAGIEINMLPYPREGIESQAGKLMARIWCQNDAPSLLSQVMKHGDTLLNPNLTCPSPGAIAQGYDLGKKMKVVGTPAIFTEDGQLLGGYLSPQELISRLKN